MLSRRRKTFLAILISFVIIFTGTNYYFMVVLIRKESEVRSSNNKLTVQEEILQKVPFVAKDYKKSSTKLNNTVTDTFIRNLRDVQIFKDKTKLWKEVRSWVSKTQLYNLSSPYLGSALHALKTSKIVKADIDSRGTQLKLLLTLEGGQNVIFKPQWYPIDKIIEGPVYAGKDRHFSEIIAFYLSGILGKPLTPLSGERRISIKTEIIPVATSRLLKTIFEKDSLTCMYGKCFYCKKKDPICEDRNGTVNGVIIFNVDVTFKINRSPWQRTYDKRTAAVWETNENYCKFVKSKMSHERLLNLIEASLFDFLIQNGDRHHYELLDENVILIDNGKGLGNPNDNHLDILAPLYQCCALRSNTWKKLKELGGGVLVEKLKQVPDLDKLITLEHLKAIEHRLLLIYATVEYCRSRNKIERVMV